MIKISLSGAHSTGKSTFIKRVCEFMEAEGIKYAVVGDLASKCPLPILKGHSIESTLWIAATGIANEVVAEKNFDVVIVDRPLLDCWAYFMAVCREKYSGDEFRMVTLENMIRNWLPTYDLSYQTVIDESVEIEDNKGRDLDKMYRTQIGKEMIDAATHFNFSCRPLTTKNSDDKLDEVKNFITAKCRR